MENGDVPSGDKEYFEGGKVTKENMTEFIKEMKKAGLTDEEASIMAASKIADSKPKSRMYYKIGASREMAGGKKVDPKAHMSDKLKVNLTNYCHELLLCMHFLFFQNMYDAVNDPNKPLADEVEKDLDPDKTVIEFSTTALAVMEDVGTCFVTIERRGKIDNEVTVKVDTIDGSADEGDDYIGVHDIFKFEAGQTEIQIEIEIVDDDDWEPDEEFFVKVAADPDSENKDIKIGKKNIMTVMILNDDEPGTFGFDKRGHFVKVNR